MRIFSLLLLSAVLLTAQNSLTVAWISDMGIAAPHGIGGMSWGFRTTTYETGERGSGVTGVVQPRNGGERVVAAMMNSWNPDYWIATGDMSNQRGNRGQTYKGLLFRTATPITAPSTAPWGTLQESITGKGGPNGQVVRVSVRGSTGRFVIGYGTPNAEVIQITSRSACAVGANDCTITAKFLKNHGIGEPIQANSQTVTVDVGASVCPPNSCLNDLHLFGVNDKYTIGGQTSGCGSGELCSPALNSIEVTVPGTARISVFNPEQSYKATSTGRFGDTVKVTGSQVDGLDGTYTITAVPVENKSGTGASIAGTNIVEVSVNPAIPVGIYTASGMAAEFKRMMFPNTYAAFQEDSFDYFEEARMDAINSTISFTGTFAKAHPAGILVRASDHVPYMNWIAAGKFIPVLGNHDNNGGEYDWCDDKNEGRGVYGTGCTEGKEYDASVEYWSSPAAGSWPFQPGKPWFEKCYGTLVCFYSMDNSRGAENFGVGTIQYNEMNPKLTNCPAKWCVPAVHFGTFSALCDNRHNPPGCKAGQPDPAYWWYVNNPKTDFIINGHGHNQQHMITNAGVVGRSIHIFQSGTGGDSIDGTNVQNGQPAADTFDACAVVGDCTTVVNRGSYTNPRSDHGGVKMIFTDTSATIEYYEVSNWVTPWHTQVISKVVEPPVPVIESPVLCEAAKVCISGGVTIQ